MDLKEAQAIGGDPALHWYYISKERAIKAMVGPDPVDEVLDVGAGTGVFSKMLLSEGICRSAVCVDPNYTDDWLAQNSGADLSYQRTIDQVRASLVLMIDVIEHVDDDVALIADYASRAQAGVRFMISAPAFNFLWSSHDDFLEHRRRYTLRSLETAVRAAGLEPVDQRYFFGYLFPVAAAMRLADRTFKGQNGVNESALKPAPAWLNKTLVALHDVERNTLFPFNRMAGVSAFCLAEKPRAA